MGTARKLRLPPNITITQRDPHVLWFGAGINRTKCQDEDYPCCPKSELTHHVMVSPIRPLYKDPFKTSQSSLRVVVIFHKSCPRNPTPKTPSLQQYTYRFRIYFRKSFTYFQIVQKKSMPRDFDHLYSALLFTVTRAITGPSHSGGVPIVTEHVQLLRFLCVPSPSPVYATTLNLNDVITWK